jgi:hypothetical protein
VETLRACKIVKVSPNFAKYLEEIKIMVEASSGKTLSSADITEIIATFRPQIIIKQEKKKSLSDMLEI